MTKKVMTILLCVAFATMMLAGCTAPATDDAAASTDAGEAETVPAEAAEAAGPTTVILTDMQGESVAIDGEIGKIVSLTPAGTEIVCALGAEELLVGVDASSNYPESVQSLEIVGDFNGPDVEKIVSMEPDLVLAGNTLQQDAIDSLRGLGITVASVEATSFDQISQSILLIGQMIGRDEEAQTLNTEMTQAIVGVQESASQEGKTVYYAMSYGDAGNWTSGPGSFINTIIALAGGIAVTDADSSLPQWLEYPVEDLAAANPDIILADSSMGSIGELSAQAGYADLDAVKNGSVYEIDADVFTRPGPRIVEALQQVGEILNNSAPVTVDETEEAAA